MDFTPLKNVTQTNIDDLNAMKTQIEAILARHQSTLAEFAQAEAAADAEKTAPATLADVKAMIARVPG